MWTAWVYNKGEVQVKISLCVCTHARTHTHTHTHTHTEANKRSYSIPKKYFPKDDKCWVNKDILLLCFWPNGPQWARASSFTKFLDHTQRRTTVGRTPLDEWSTRRRDLYLTTHNTHNRHACYRWDSNPQSQQASGSRRTLQTARPWDRHPTF